MGEVCGTEPPPPRKLRLCQRSHNRAVTDCRYLQEGVDADGRHVVVLVGDSDDDDGVGRARVAAAAVPGAHQQPIDRRYLAVDPPDHRHVTGQLVDVEHSAAGTRQRRRAQVVLHLPNRIKQGNCRQQTAPPLRCCPVVGQSAGRRRTLDRRDSTASTR